MVSTQRSNVLLAGKVTPEEDKALKEATRFMNPSEETQAILKERINRITSELKKHKSEPKVDIPYVPVTCFLGDYEERYYE